MNTTDLKRLQALETQIAATAEDQRAPLIAALERLVSEARSRGVAPTCDQDILDEDFFDNMPV